MDAQIAELKMERERLAGDRRRVRKDLKHAQKRRSRLKKKASRLSNTDLFDLIQLRELKAQLLGATAEHTAPAAAAVVEDAGPGAANEEGVGESFFLARPAHRYD